MIHNFYIVRKNGICVFHRKFGSLEEDPQSMAGFLTAISMFARATIGEDIKSLATDNFKFLFKSYGEFTFITFVDTSDENNNVQDLLKDVEECFRGLFPNANNTCTNGNLLIFRAFNQPLETLVNTFHQKKLDTPKIFTEVCTTNH